MTRRNRPSISITISKPLLDELDELARKLGKTRSDVIERCILAGLEKVKKLVEGGEEEKAEASRGLEDAYMRSRLFDRRYDYLWEPV